MIRPELSVMVKKAMEDPAYLDRVLADPVSAGREVGVELTDDEVTQIRPLSAEQAREMVASGRSGC